MSDKITPEELEMLQERIDDPDWDISQQNDVWEMLPRLLELARLSNVTICAYCEHESPRDDPIAIVEHIMVCEKRPEKKLLEKAFEVEDRLYQRIMHVTGTGGDSVAHYWPNDCDTCKEIAEILDIYKKGDESDNQPPVGE